MRKGNENKRIMSEIKLTSHFKGLVHWRAHIHSFSRLLFRFHHFKNNRFSIHSFIHFGCVLKYIFEIDPAIQFIRLRERCIFCTARHSTERTKCYKNFYNIILKRWMYGIFCSHFIDHIVQNRCRCYCYCYFNSTFCVNSVKPNFKPKKLNSNESPLKKVNGCLERILKNVRSYILDTHLNCMRGRDGAFHRKK